LRLLKRRGSDKRERDGDFVIPLRYCYAPPVSRGKQPG